MSRLYSWSRFALRTAAAAAERDIKPSKLVFVVTKRCHSRCVYCDIWKVKDTPGGLDGELSLDEVTTFAKRNPYLHWIDFTGGEPTDRPDFVQVIQAFAEHCPDLVLVHFPTNGIATKRITGVVAALKESIRAKLVVTVSIDGPPEINDRLRGIRNDFAHAVATFSEVRKTLGPEGAFVGMTLHGHSGSCGMQTVDLMRRTFAAVNEALLEKNVAPIGWSSFHLNIPHLSQHYYGNSAAPSQDGFGSAAHRAEIAAALAFASEQEKQGSLGMRVVERVFRAEASRYLSSGKTEIPCSALLQTAYLSEKGDVYPCTIWNKALGNVRTSDYQLMPLIERARAEGLRKAVREGKCPRCWTPCEAYPAILAAPYQSARALLR